MSPNWKKITAISVGGHFLSRKSHRFTMQGNGGLSEVHRTYV